MLQPHSDAWYDRLAGLQEGYYYPWRSTLPLLNGEDEYLALAHELVAPGLDVLDVGCGHGAVALQLSAFCRRIVAYDRVTAYVHLARRTAAARGVRNVTFVEADSLAALLSTSELPPDLRRFDLIFSRRGPLNWVEEVRTVAKPGTILFVLNPKESVLPAWNERLPESLRLANPRTYSRQSSVERRLDKAGLALRSAWSFDVPEYFATPRDLYNKLSWGSLPEEVPAYTAVSGLLAEIFAGYATPQGLAVPHGRFLWQAIVD